MKNQRLGKAELEQIINGNDKLAEQLYRYVLYYLFKIRGNFEMSESLVEDIAQNTLLIVIRNGQKGKIRFESSLETYAIAIAKRLIWQFCSNKNELNTQEIENYENIQTPAKETEIHADEVKWNIFYREFRNLSEECRKMFRLLVKKKKYDEISDLMGYASYKYVKIKMQRCRRSFRKLVKNNPDYKKYKDYDRQDFEIFG